MRSTAGFSIFELSIVVLILSVLGAAAVPTARKLIIEARATVVINDLRVFAGALQTYAHENGDWPAEEESPGSFPPGMEGYLQGSNWLQPTPIGGRYNWDYNRRHQGERFRAAISIVDADGQPVSTDRNQLLDIDRKIDDGNLSTGSFRLGFRNFPLFVLER